MKYGHDLHLRGFWACFVKKMFFCIAWLMGAFLKGDEAGFASSLFIIRTSVGAVLWFKFAMLSEKRPAAEPTEDAVNASSWKFGCRKLLCCAGARTKSC